MTKGEVNLATTDQRDVCERSKGHTPLNWARLSMSSAGTPFRLLGGSRFGVLAFLRLPEMSNCCCLPARAGGSPSMV